MGKHTVKTASVGRQKIFFPTARQYILIRRSPHQVMQFLRFLQNLFTITKTHDGSKQTANLNILFLCISMWKLYRISLYEINTVELLRPCQKAQFRFFGHLEKLRFYLKCKDIEFIVTSNKSPVPFPPIFVS